MSRVRAVLFDKDGVLVDFHETWGPATAEAIRACAADDIQARDIAGAMDFCLDTHRYAPSSVFIAGSAQESRDVLIKVPGIDDAFIAALFQRTVAAGARMVAAPPEVPVALRALRAQGMPLGVATNDTEASARQQMASLGLTDLFEAIMGADSGHGAKPGPGMLLAYAAHLGIDPATMAMVGDSTHDLHAARAAGAIGIGIGTGPASLDDLAPHADYVVETMEDLPDLIAGL